MSEAVTELNNEAVKPAKTVFTGFSKTHTLIFLAIIFLLALSLRAYTAKFDAFMGADPYYHMRMTQTVFETGEIPTHDEVAFFNFGGRDITDPPLFWVFGAILMNLTGLSVLNYGLIIPALLGSLSVFVFFILGRDLENDTLGIFMAFTLAVLPAFIYRGVAGFAEEDILGIFLGLILFMFLIRALKRDDWKYGLFAVFTLGTLAMTWKFFVFFAFFCILFLFFHVLSCLVRERTKSIFIPVVLIVLTIGISFLFYAPQIMSYAENYMAVLMPSNIVGEEFLGVLFFWEKFSMFLIPFTIGFFISFYYLKKKPIHLFTVLLIVISIILAFLKLKFAFVAGPGIALGSAIGLFWLIDKKELSYNLFFVVFILISLLFVGIFFVEHQKSSFVLYGFEETTAWMQENIPENSKIGAWWDYGHFLTFSKYKIPVDNTSPGHRDSSIIAKAFLNSPDDAYASFVSLDVDYVLITERDLAELLPVGIFNNYVNKDLPSFKVESTTCQIEESGLLRSKDYKCNIFNFSETDFEKISTKWVSEQNIIMGGRLVNAYRGACVSNPEIEKDFKSQCERTKDLYVLGANANQTFLAKAFFGDPELSKYFKLVYSSPQVKIYKVLK